MSIIWPKNIHAKSSASFFFKNINKALPDSSGTILVEKEDKLVGCALVFLNGESIVPEYFGLDYPYNSEFCIYFNLFYKMVEIAIDEGYKEVGMGITTLAPKKDIGADVVDLCMYLKCLNPLMNRFVPRIVEAMTPRDNT